MKKIFAILLVFTVIVVLALLNTQIYSKKNYNPKDEIQNIKPPDNGLSTTIENMADSVQIEENFKGCIPKIS